MTTSTPSSTHIYLLISEEDLRAARKEGALRRPSLQEEGFLHASPASQLTRVANKHYTDTDKTRILRIAIDRVAPEVRWEPATGGLYPHIYGPLNMDAVDADVPAPRDAGGQYLIRPEDLDAEHGEAK